VAFGGLGGVAGARYIQPGSLHPAGRYVRTSQNGIPAVPAEVYPALVLDIFWRKNGPGGTPPGVEDGNNGALQYLSIASINTEDETVFLAACDTDATDDEGTLTTERPSVATGGMHSLPENFGRGSGRWRPGDEDFINLWFRLPQVCQDPLTPFGIMLPHMVSVTFIPVTVAPLSDALSLFGNLRILVRNSGAAAIPVGVGFPNPPIMNLEFMHTIQR
jgi:hypothetical protein